MEASRQPVHKRKLAVQRALPLISLLLVWSLVPAIASGSETDLRQEEKEAHAFTDGHLRPGHFETIRVKGLPGRGRTEVTFFPTAICGSKCGAPGRQGTGTNGRGSGKFVVRMPGTFVAHDGKHVYFRDGERIDVQVLWYGPGETFEVASVSPEPIIVRTHRPQHG